MDESDALKWHEIVERRANRVFRIACRILGSVHDVEAAGDIFECFIAAGLLKSAVYCKPTRVSISVPPQKLHRSQHPSNEGGCLRENPPQQVVVKAAEVHLTGSFQTDFFRTLICPTVSS